MEGAQRRNICLRTSVMPGAELPSKLQPEIAAACTSRLSHLGPSAALGLPSRLYQHGDPTMQATEEYLSQLLNRDPASFLERYGKHLTSDELAAFGPLSHDYEVHHWFATLTAAKATATSSPLAQGVVSRGGITAQARNRRLAAMQQLREAGEFFSMEAMQERDPLLYQQYIGQYEDDEELEGGDTEEKLSAGLMRRYEQAQLKARIEKLQREQEEEDDDSQVSEHESDTDDSDDDDKGAHGGRRMHVDPTPPQPPPPPLRGAAIRGIPSGGRKPITSATPKPAGAGQGTGAPASGGLVREGEGLARVAGALARGGGGGLASGSGTGTGDAPDAHCAGQASQPKSTVVPAREAPSRSRPAAERPTQTQAPGVGDPAAPCQDRVGGPRSAQGVRFQVPAPEAEEPGATRAADGGDAGTSPSGGQPSARGAAAKAEKEERERQFLEEMEARFLSGRDAQFVDYVGIDANELLDDHWLHQRGQDAEDKYFEAEEEAGEGRGGDAGGRGGRGACGMEGVEGVGDGGPGELEEWERMAMDGVCGR